MQDSLHSRPGPTRDLGPERVARRMRELEQTARVLAAARPQRNLTRKAKLDACFAQGLWQCGFRGSHASTMRGVGLASTPASTSILADAFIDVRILTRGAGRRDRPPMP